MHGLLWRVPGYGPAEVLDLLQDHGVEQTSEAGHWLGWALGQGEDAEIEPGVGLWEVALDRDLAPEAYSGWGWWATVDLLDDDRWLALTEQMLQRTGGNVMEPDRIAARAGRNPDDSRALRIVALLLEGEPPLWDLGKIGDAGLSLLASHPAGSSEWSDLRDRLVERGFHEALDEPSA